MRGKVAIVTGGGGGIGRGICLYLHRKGIKIAVMDIGSEISGEGRDISVAESVVDEIRKEGGEAITIFESVYDEGGVEKAVKEVVNTFGKVDILINCAGNLVDKPLVEMKTEEFMSVINVHLLGTFLMGRECAKYMIKEGWGRIVNFTSISGILGNHGQSNYASAKAGVIGLTKTWAIELGKFGIKVNAVSPIAKTRQTINVPFSFEEEPKPEYIAPVVGYLVSDKVKISGEVIVVYGKKIFSYNPVFSKGIKLIKTTEEEIEKNIEKILYDL